jgi:hypothetical protein
MSSIKKGFISNYGRSRNCTLLVSMLLGVVTVTEPVLAFNDAAVNVLEPRKIKNLLPASVKNDLLRSIRQQKRMWLRCQRGGFVTSS